MFPPQTYSKRPNTRSARWCKSPVSARAASSNHSGQLPRSCGIGTMGPPASIGASLRRANRSRYAAGNFISRTEDLSPRGFDAIANIVFHGTFYVTHAVGKRWIAGGHKGSVISIVVTWVWTGSPFVVPSAMSKAGVHVMTQSLAVEWGRYGIRLNAIAPGIFPTEGAGKRLAPGRDSGRDAAAVNPMRRAGKMEELQNLAAFLMADGCEFLTGQTIAVDGAACLVNGGSFNELFAWTDADWEKARAAIKAQNEKDKQQRSV